MDNHENTIRCRICKEEFTHETTLDEFLDHMSNHESKGEDIYTRLFRDLELKDDSSETLWS